jgi:2-hydroxy-6-oxonona-2,4-dienedioate hydrolase
MTAIFKSEQARTRMVEWYERFRARLPVATDSRHVATRFGDTHVLVGGPADAPALVAVHGAMASSAHMLVELQPLLDRYRVYAVDVLGQSPNTPHPRPPVKTNAYGEWLADVLDGLGLATASLVAVSWGGFAAIRLAAHAPDRIDKLALLVPAGVVNGRAWQGITKMMIPLALYRMSRSEARWQAFARNLLTTHDDDWMPYLRDAFDSFHMDMRVPRLATVDELAGLRAPVFIVAGDQDISFPGAKLVDRARQLFPTLAGHELVEDCRHCPPTTDAFRKWLADTLDGFLRAPASVANASTG